MIVCVGIVGVEADGLAEISYRMLKLAQVTVGDASVVVGESSFGIEADCFVEVLDGSVKLA